MSSRSWGALVGIALLVVALGVFRASSTPAPTTAGPPAASEPEVALPTILDFGRGECLPCQKMMPVLETLAERHEGRIRVQYLDLAEPLNQERATELHVRVIPTQVLVAADGTEVDRHEGFWALDEVETRMGELGWTTER